MSKLRWSIKYREYVALLGQGDIWTREDFAKKMGVSYTTAVYHLNAAVQAGQLNAAIGYVSQSKVGWLYALPSTMPRLGGM